MRLYFTPLYIVMALIAKYLIGMGFVCCMCSMLVPGGILNLLLCRVFREE